RRDRKTGDQLHRSEVDCAARLRQPRQPQSAPPPKLEPGQTPPYGVAYGAGHLSANGLMISQLANVLSPYVDRPVIDRTGLSGGFDVTLTWTPSPGESTGPGEDERAPLHPTSDGPSIFTAIQEQLGLKLESTNGPVDVLVIDHVEPPTPD